ncbi:hypothetical protein [Clostridioides sp. ES-S-0048-02]|uniref:hypothetical protein n=1 Tax=Clostridioides sp. ES-S-0048-02 TaxID=2770777 RepID=UPI001D10081D|nr:hypothetical protein [Clostridioides sp. ES-S-0048-02]
MYYYWKTKGIRPSLFYAMDKGELKIIEAFFALEIEEEVEKMKHGYGVCPLTGGGI